MAAAAQDRQPMMGGDMPGNERLWNALRIVGWSVATLLFLLPVVAMQFTDEVDWTLSDFVFAGVLLGGSGLLCELAIRRSRDDAYRVGALLGLATIFLLAWSNAAVGFVGSGANAANVMYFAMIAIPFVGAFIAGLKARGMYAAMVFTAVAQASITLFAYAADLVQGDERILIWAINAVFIFLWLASAMLFRQAADSEASRLAGSHGSNGRWGAYPIQFVLSMLLTAIGSILLFIMITMEDEPGAIPLLMFVMGLAWFFITLYRSKAAHTK